MANVKKYIVLLSHVQFSYAAFWEIMLPQVQNSTKFDVYLWLSSVKYKVVRKFWLCYC